jgi:sulfur carrier protein
VKITVNTEPETWAEDSLSIRDILDRKRWSFPLIIAKLNGESVPREEYSSRLVREGDALELYHLVSGG